MQKNLEFYVDGGIIELTLTEGVVYIEGHTGYRQEYYQCPLDLSTEAGGDKQDCTRIWRQGRF